MTAARLEMNLPPATEPRVGEPVTFGIPFPRGACAHAANIRVHHAGANQPVQAQAIDRWPDGSVRWALLDFKAVVPSEYVIDVGRSPGSATRSEEIHLNCGSSEVHAAVGPFSCRFRQGAAHLMEVFFEGGSRQIDVTAVDHTHAAVPVITTGVRTEAAGPLRVTLLLEGVIGSAAAPLLEFEARCHLFAGVPGVRMEFTIRNPRRARHAGGYWELGDDGSVYLRDLTIHLRSAGSTPSEVSVCCSIAESQPPLKLQRPVQVDQRSSGGEHWQSRVHVNRHGVVPLHHEGYQLRWNGGTNTGRRASPVLWTDDGSGIVAVAMQHFWENFPKVLEADDRGFAVRLFPLHSVDVHEIQAGEQKTHTIGFAFGEDPISRIPLDWVRQPAIPSLEAAWYTQACAVPYLTPARDDPHHDYLSLVSAAIEGDDSFTRKRERIDEFGWRNFGDIYADHEAVSSADGSGFVSHYNNQYDAVAGFAIQFMRTADPRWRRAMCELARHVVDIDIYHTNRDKSAYNGGLFWHTFHYVDAGKSTHRAYPKAPGVWGGGPSNEHNYSTGLMLHYFLTGHEPSRAAVLSLARWVRDMDDGGLSMFRWLTRSDTGLASSTASSSYHGPGRGAANSIVTLLNACRLTGDRLWLDKAEALIRRCIHPSDDIDSRDLLNAELRWSYTVFLEALGYYLDQKIILGEIDFRYAYAKESLLHYAGWMARREYPYLDKPEILEFPTETWAAQDMRKSDVFTFAARHADTAERHVFLERAELFFRASLDRLRSFPTRTRARPVVLMLSHGYMHAAAKKADGLPPAPPAPAGCEFGSPLTFIPQKEIARRRATGLALGASCAVLAALIWFFIAL